MAKKETKQKSAAKEAAKKAAHVEVLQMNDIANLAKEQASNGLDPNHQVDAMMFLDRRFYQDPNAAKKYNMEQETVDQINEITMIGMVTVIGNEIVSGNTKWAATMRKAVLPQFIDIAKKLNIEIDEKKLLPAPDNKEQVVLPAEAVTIDKETAKKIEEEKEAGLKQVKTDPTKIENDQELKDALLKILINGNGSENFYDKVMTAINFHRAYLGVQASKSNDKSEAEIVKNMSHYEILEDIATRLGRCTFTIGGMAKFLFESTQKSKSPVAAFCTFRDASLNKKTGMPQIDDQLCADIVKVLIKWYTNSEIAAANESIEACNKNIEILKKDEKKNAKAIKGNEDEIKKINGKIAEFEKVLGYATDPSCDTVDDWLDVYNDNKNEGFKAARMTASKICKTYYPGMDIKEVDAETLQNNLHQYVGVITNMFRDPLSQMIRYSETNIVEIKYEPKGSKKE